MTPEQDQVAWAREMFKFSLGLGAQAGARISTWLVIGNAGALAIAFGAQLNGTSCEPQLVYRAAMFFALGLGSAFLASVVGWVGSQVGVQTMRKALDASTMLANAAHHIKELEARGIPTKEGDPLQKMYDEAGETMLGVTYRVTIGLAIASAVLVLLSAAAFAVGVATPLTSPAGAFSSCEKSSHLPLQPPAEKAS